MNDQSQSEFLSNFDLFLQQYINELNIPCPRMREGLSYVLFPGGKRFRPLLIYFSGQLFDLKTATLTALAAAVECIHSYSLVHDDLPAMDNDDFRRGRLSCHKAFDEASAILVGDGLQSLAFQILLDFLPPHLASERIIKIISELVKAIGLSGMVSGQSLDLTMLKDSQIAEKQLQEIHQLKTTALISAAINMVLAAGNPTAAQIKALNHFANNLGLVFQMHDDYLDRYAKNLGKNRSSDLANCKTTFASFYTKDKLLELIHDKYQQIKDNLAIFTPKANNLLTLIHTLELRS